MASSSYQFDNNVGHFSFFSALVPADVYDCYVEQLVPMFFVLVTVTVTVKDQVTVYAFYAFYAWWIAFYAFYARSMRGGFIPRNWGPSLITVMVMITESRLISFSALRLPHAFTA